MAVRGRDFTKKEVVKKIVKIFSSNSCNWKDFFISNSKLFKFVNADIAFNSGCNFANGTFSSQQNTGQSGQK